MLHRLLKYGIVKYLGLQDKYLNGKTAGNK
jgi:hypothetical protein